MLKPSLPSSRRRADAVAVLVALVLPTVLTWFYFVYLAQQPGTMQQLVFGGCKMLMYVLPVVWVVGVQRERLTWPATTAGIAEGLGFGLAVFAGMLLLYYGWWKPAGMLEVGAVAMREKLLGFGLDTPAKYLALAVGLSLLNSAFEEYYFRWFIFGQLRRLIPVGLAVAISSLGFAAHHVVVLGLYFGWLSPLAWFFALCVAVGGAYWAWLYQRSGSLLGPWLSHLVIDAAIFLVGYDLVIIQK